MDGGIKFELTKRHFDINNFKVWLDEINNIATFPLYGVCSKRLLGYQQYNPSTTCKKRNNPRDSRYFTYHRSIKDIGECVVWGLDNLNSKPILYLTEGVFEAARLLSLGYDAVALLTASPHKDVVAQLYNLGYSKLVWLGDNDKAGRGSAVSKKVDKSIYFEYDVDEVCESLLVNTLNNYEVSLEKRND